MTRDVRLAIDSATDLLSVAAGRQGEAPVIATALGAREHASAMLPLIDRVLGSLGAGPGDLELVAVSDGPGSFTGLRVGIAVAKALALGAGIPLWTAPSLLLRAAGVATSGQAVLALSSALRGEAYAGIWRFETGGAVTTLLPPRTVGQSDIGGLPPVDRIAGEAPEPLISELTLRYGAASLPPVVASPRAELLLELLGRPGGARQVTEPASWEPVYGRPAEAQAKWEREHGRPLPDPSSPGR